MQQTLGWTASDRTHDSALAGIDHEAFARQDESVCLEARYEVQPVVASTRADYPEQVGEVWLRRGLALEQRGMEGDALFAEDSCFGQQAARFKIITEEQARQLVRDAARLRSEGQETSARQLALERGWVDALKCTQVCNAMKDHVRYCKSCEKNVYPLPEDALSARRCAECGSVLSGTREGGEIDVYKSPTIDRDVFASEKKPDIPPARASEEARPAKPKELARPDSELVCPQCGYKNAVDSGLCNLCGALLREEKGRPERRRGLEGHYRSCAACGRSRVKLYRAVCRTAGAATPAPGEGAPSDGAQQGHLSGWICRDCVVGRRRRYVWIAGISVALAVLVVVLTILPAGPHALIAGLAAAVLMAIFPGSLAGICVARALKDGDELADDAFGSLTKKQGKLGDAAKLYTRRGRRIML